MLMDYRDRARAGHPIGIGGRTCACCGDGGPGSPARRRARRVTKRRERQIVRRQIESGE